MEKTFAELLDDSMKYHQITNKSLAKEINVAPITISRWRKGEEIDDKIQIPSKREYLLACIKPLRFAQNDQNGLDDCNCFFKAARHAPLTIEEQKKYFPRLTIEPPQASTNPQQDLGEMPDVSTFYGRTQELENLKQWIIVDKKRIVTIWGMDSIGKSLLASKLLTQISDDFEYCIWKSLREAPLVEKILADIIKFLSPSQTIELPLTIKRLIHLLNESRCLLVLDNVETILQDGTSPGQYQEKHKGYGQLIEQIGESQHQSCLLLTSQQKLRGILNHSQFLELKGLKLLEAQKFFRDLLASDTDKEKIIQHYEGNPSALKIVMAGIQNTYSGNISAFMEDLANGQFIFNDIRDLLKRQFRKISAPERKVIYWLTINRDAVSKNQLCDDMGEVSPSLKDKIGNVLEDLERRSLIEKVKEKFTLQNDVMQYAIEEFIVQIIEEIKTGQISLFNTHTLLKADSKDDIREAQHRLILVPVKERLIANLGKTALETQLMQIITILRSEKKPGYAAGNILNLLCEIGSDLTAYDFSHLTIWQAYLPKVNLSKVNFAHSQFAKSVFTQSFGQILSLASRGKILAAGDRKGYIHLWSDASTIPDSYQAHDSCISSLAFSPEGQILASGSDDHKVKIWEVIEASESIELKCLNILEGHQHSVLSIAFSQQGDKLLSGGHLGKVKLWDVYKGQQIKSWNAHDNRIWSIAFSSDTFATGGKDNSLKIWKIDEDEPIESVSFASEVRVLAFTPDGKQLAIACIDGSLRLRHLDNLKEDLWQTTHSGSVLAIAFSSDGKSMATSTIDKTVKLWQIDGMQEIFTLKEHQDRVKSLAFIRRPDNYYRLASGSDDQSVKIWDISEGKCIKTLQGYANRIWSIAFSPQVDSQILASGYDDNIVRLWDLSEERKKLEGHKDRVYSVVFSPDGTQLITGSRDKTVRIWNIPEANIQAAKHFKLLKANDEVFTVAISPNGQYIAAGNQDGSIQIWDIFNDFKNHHSLAGNQGGVQTVAFSPDNRTLAIGTREGIVTLWNIENAQSLYNLKAYQNRIRSVHFSSDGQYLFVSVNGEESVTRWKLDNGKYSHEQCLKKVGTHIRSVALSPDNETIACGGENSVKIFSNIYDDEKEPIEVLKHNSIVRSVAFSPDGQRLASGSENGTIKLLHIETDQEQTLKVHKPYKDMNIIGITGLTEDEKASLKILGAVEKEENYE